MVNFYDFYVTNLVCFYQLPPNKFNILFMRHLVLWRIWIIHKKSYPQIILSVSTKRLLFCAFFLLLFNCEVLCSVIRLRPFFLFIDNIALFISLPLYQRICETINYYLFLFLRLLEEPDRSQGLKTKVLQLSLFFIGCKN